MLTQTPQCYIVPITNEEKEDMNEYIIWYYNSIYIVITLPVLLILCRVIDTEASEDLSN